MRRQRIKEREQGAMLQELLQQVLAPPQPPPRLPPCTLGLQQQLIMSHHQQQQQQPQEGAGTPWHAMHAKECSRTSSGPLVGPSPAGGGGVVVLVLPPGMPAPSSHWAPLRCPSLAPPTSRQASLGPPTPCQGPAATPFGTSAGDPSLLCPLLTASPAVLPELMRQPVVQLPPPPGRGPGPCRAARPAARAAHPNGSAGAGAGGLPRLPRALPHPLGRLLHWGPGAARGAARGAAGVFGDLGVPAQPGPGLRPGPRAVFPGLTLMRASPGKPT